MRSVCIVVVCRRKAALHTVTVCFKSFSCVFSFALLFFFSLCDSSAVMGSSWLWFRTSVWKLGNFSHRSFWAFCPLTGNGVFLTLMLSEVLGSANLRQIDIRAQAPFWSVCKKNKKKQTKKQGENDTRKGNVLARFLKGCIFIIYS